jgi:colanic acid biosynthesis protein WcaH
MVFEDKRMSFIPQDLYNQFLENMPIVCTDLLIWNEGKYLLVRRKNEPAKDMVWFPGGRILKGELSEKAALRIARSEVGLECTVRKNLGTYETIFKSGPFGISVHSINLCYLLHASSSIVHLDNDHSEYFWVAQDRCPPELDPRLKNFVEAVFGDY